MDTWAKTLVTAGYCQLLYDDSILILLQKLILLCHVCHSEKGCTKDTCMHVFKK